MLMFCPRLKTEVTELDCLTTHSALVSALALLGVHAPPSFTVLKDGMVHVGEAMPGGTAPSDSDLGGGG